MRTTMRAAAWATAIVSGLALLAGTGVAAGTPLVRTAQNAKLHAKVLINRSGRTLYRLSVEHKGHLICTDATCPRYGIR